MSQTNKILQTDEIYLRETTIDDIDNGWLDWINNRYLLKYLSNSSGYKREELVNYLKKSQLPDAKMFAICRIKDDLYIGNARLSAIDNKNFSAAYGRLIGIKNNECKNVGTNTLLMLAYYAFNVLKLNRIYTGVVVDNIASIKSNIKAGFNHEGTFRESAYIDGEFKDSMQFSMLRSEFNKNKLSSKLIVHNEIC